MKIKMVFECTGRAVVDVNFPDEMFYEDENFSDYKLSKYNFTDEGIEEIGKYLCGLTNEDISKMPFEMDCDSLSISMAKDNDGKIIENW